MRRAFTASPPLARVAGNSYNARAFEGWPLALGQKLRPPKTPF